MGRLPLRPNWAPARTSTAPRQQVCSATTAPNGCGRSPFPSGRHHGRQAAPNARTTPAVTTATVQTVARVMAAAASRTRHIHAHNTAAACEYTTRSRSAHSGARAAPANLAAACNHSCARARLTPRGTAARGASRRALYDTTTSSRRHATTTLDSYAGATAALRHPQSPRQRSDPAGGGDDSTVAAPRTLHRPHSPTPAATTATVQRWRESWRRGVTNASHPRAQRGGACEYTLARAAHTAALRHPQSPHRASDPAGGGSDSTVAAPRSSAPPALTAGGATPDTHDVHNATPRATPLGTSRTHTTRLPV